LLVHRVSITPLVARVIVTGGAGFIGSYVAETFLARGDDVVVVDDLSTGSERNVPARAQLERVDITDADALAGAFAGGADVVCHLAAQASVLVSAERPDYDCAVNVLGTLNVLEAARGAGAPVVFASTGGAIYGNGAPLPTPEDYAPKPLAPYGASKLAAEAYVETWTRLHDVPNVVLRLGNVYGPRQNPHGEAGVVAIFSDKLFAGERPVLRGGGTPKRDYVHVSDVAHAFVLAADGGRGGTFNVGTGVGTSTARLLELLQEAAGTSIEPRDEPLKAGELDASVVDTSRIERELGWRPTIALENGLRETVAWYRDATSSAEAAGRG
jgi:UDP-glucose 4-epimerase